jgi:xanthine dehydrogenase large subunit
MLSTYKVPDLLSIPEMEVVFLADAANPAAVLQSKAIGEPPLMYGIGAYLALLDAIRAARPDIEPFFEAPMTPERVLLALAGARPGPAAGDPGARPAASTTGPSPRHREPVAPAAT